IGSFFDGLTAAPASVRSVRQPELSPLDDVAGLRSERGTDSVIQRSELSDDTQMTQVATKGVTGQCLPRMSSNLRPPPLADHGVLRRAGRRSPTARVAFEIFSAVPLSAEPPHDTEQQRKRGLREPLFGAA